MACSSCGENHRAFTSSCPNYYSDIRLRHPLEQDMFVEWDFDLLAHAFCLLNHDAGRRRLDLIEAMRRGTFAWHMLEQWFHDRTSGTGDRFETEGGGSQGPDLIGNSGATYEVRSITSNSFNLRASIDTGGQRAPEWNREQLLSVDYYVFVDRTYFPDPMPVYIVNSQGIFEIDHPDLIFLDRSGQTRSYRFARRLIALAQQYDD